MNALPQPVFDRATCSPYKAEGTTVYKTASKAMGYRTLVRVPSFQMCEANPSLEDPHAAARLIADALNAHALIRATGAHQQKTAVRYWLEAYLSSVSIPRTEPDLWLAEYQSARDRAARILAKHGLIGLIVEVSQVLTREGNHFT